jgi:hypothetical protein
VALFTVVLQSSCVRASLRLVLTKSSPARFEEEYEAEEFHPVMQSLFDTWNFSRYKIRRKCGKK